jgi:hypothetical protein
MKSPPVIFRASFYYYSQRTCSFLVNVNIYHKTEFSHQFCSSYGPFLAKYILLLRCTPWTCTCSRTSLLLRLTRKTNCKTFLKSGFLFKCFKVILHISTCMAIFKCEMLCVEDRCASDMFVQVFLFFPTLFQLCFSVSHSDGPLSLCVACVCYDDGHIGQTHSVF